MAEVTFKQFSDVYIIPYFIVAYLYIDLVLLFTLAVICSRGIALCRKFKRNKGKSSKKVEVYELQETGGNTEVTPEQPQQDRVMTGIFYTCYTKISGWIVRFNSWLIQLIFGESEVFSEDDRGKGVYINGKKLKSIDVNILGAIIICFGMLVAISAYCTYLLEVTYTCSDDGSIYCYLDYFNYNDSDDTYISEIDLKYPIYDCAMWTNSSLAPYIDFICFQYVLNAEGALAVAGGLLSVFTIATKITVSIIIFVFKKCKLYKFKTFVAIMQLSLAIIILCVDILTALTLLTFDLADNLGGLLYAFDSVNEEDESSVQTHGIQFLVISGTIALLLLIPWAYYADPEKKQKHRATETTDISNTG